MRYPSKAQQNEAAYYERVRKEAADLRRRLAGERILRWGSMYESGWRITAERPADGPPSWVWERVEAGRVVEAYRVSMTPGVELPEATAKVIDAIAKSAQCPEALRADWARENRGW